MVWRAYLDYRSNTFSSKNCTISSRQGGDFIGFEAHMPPFSTCICGKKLPSSMASRANCKKKITVRCHLVEGSSMHTGVLVPLTSVTKYLIGGCYSVVEQTMPLPKSSSGHFIHDISALPNALLQSKAFPTRNSSHSMIRSLVWNSSYYTACM